MCTTTYFLYYCLLQLNVYVRYVIICRLIVVDRADRQSVQTIIIVQYDSYARPVSRPSVYRMFAVTDYAISAWLFSILSWLSFFFLLLNLAQYLIEKIPVSVSYMSPTVTFFPIAILQSSGKLIDLRWFAFLFVFFYFRTMSISYVSRQIVSDIFFFTAYSRIMLFDQL